VTAKKTERAKRKHDAFPRWRAWLLGLVLVASTVFAYQQVWHAGYIWDDDVYLTENKLLTAPDGLRRIWFSLESPSQYFPLVYTTFRIERALWGLNPAGYHWVNILLHTTNALLLWRLLRNLRVPGAWLAAALFALHPVQVESVAWITERKNVLMGFFFLLTLLSWVRFLERDSAGRRKFYITALVCYALALFSKTTACTLPAALLLILWLRKEPINWRRIIQITPFVVLGIAMGVVSLWWERFHQGTQGAPFAVAFPERILIASRAVWFYLSKLFWPSNLTFSYPRWTIAAANPLDYVWLLALAGVGVAIYFARRYVGRSVAVAALFFVATLSPMLGLIMLYTFRYSFVADHYQYLASIGPLTLVAIGMSRFFAGETTRLFRTPVVAALLLSLAVLTWRQGAMYFDEKTLWRATLARNPASWMAYVNLGNTFVVEGRPEEAVAHYWKALEVNPSHAEAYYNLGRTVGDAGRVEEAIAYYNKALQISPDFAQAHYNLGNTFLRLGRLDQAITHLRQALEIAPHFVDAHNNLGNALRDNGRVEEAIAHFNKALEIDPDSIAARNNLGNALLRLGRTDEALAQLQKALAREPGNAETRINLAGVLLQMGRFDEAIDHLQKAVQIAPGKAEAHYNLGGALLRAGRLDEAITQFNQVLEIDPNDAPSQNNLANALAAVGRVEEAVAHYNTALQINPDYASAHYNLGNALARLGRIDEANTHWQRARELESELERRRARSH
jgi:tetratricopeptide (TPR) repeat protein